MRYDFSRFDFLVFDLMHFFGTVVDANVSRCQDLDFIYTNFRGPTTETFENMSDFENKCAGRALLLRNWSDLTENVDFQKKVRLNGFCSMFDFRGPIIDNSLSKISNTLEKEKQAYFS